MDRVLITEADPRGPDAQEALTAYVLEVREAAGLDALDVEPALRDVDGFVQAPGFFLIATREARVVGCVGLRPWRGTTAEIKRMWVAPDLRGTGLAVTLLEEVEQRAFARGFVRLLLDTNGALTAALRFYAGRGYEPIPRYNDNPDATHFFAKDLGSTRD